MIEPKRPVDPNDLMALGAYLLMYGLMPGYVARLLTEVVVWRFGLDPVVLSR